MSKLERIAPGYYMVVETDEERRKVYSLSPDQVKNLLAPIKSRAIAEEIARKYEQARQSERDK